ncbi:KTSC domain-containing protein [Paenibacillus hunanensis]|uniref:KTSC domain-containing protein n=1 Tax=Paenibacillus hunanensis TaxID=539262 RepID=UPI002025C9A1|nr:KTSC domain-containing protein [Paenibacillus hunanensis]MCL9662191.1 KTSC domain-containing protein [Paenibacillus hunanensis]
MLWHNIVSSHLEAVSYDPLYSTCYIKFKSGAIYAYLRVPASVYYAWLVAPSHGVYHNQHMRNQYEYKLIQKIA